MNNRSVIQALEELSEKEKSVLKEAVYASISGDKQILWDSMDSIINILVGSDIRIDELYEVINNR